jgi:hypothetical protein
MNTHEIGGRLAQILHTAQANGIALPCILVCVSRNGGVTITKHLDETSAELLARHNEPEGFTLPISALVVDAAGEARRIVLVAENPGRPKLN